MRIKGPNSTKYEDFRKRLLQDSEVRKEYEALQPQFKLIKQLIARRNELNLSQEQLAKRVGTTQPAICRLESGSTNTTISTLQKVAAALDTELEISLKVR
ncbi:helix-turn-helix domain-containing protein [Chloroflexota bacterium]